MAKTKITDKQKQLIMLFGISVLILLFVGLFFLTFHKKADTGLANAGDKKGAFNAVLPDASVPAENKNKMEVYMQAHNDSIARAAQLENDPYLRKMNQDLHSGDSLQAFPGNTATGERGAMSEREREMQQKLSEMERLLSSGQTSATSSRLYTGSSAGSATAYGP